MQSTALKASEDTGRVPHEKLSKWSVVLRFLCLNSRGDFFEVASNRLENTLSENSKLLRQKSPTERYIRALLD